MDTGWKNPILKVKAPRVVLEPIEPISLEDVEALIDSCDDNDKTGLRAIPSPIELSASRRQIKTPP